MDTLYIGDIPTNYHYAAFSNDYVTLYNKPYGQNETLDYYRIYFNYDNFIYSTGVSSFSNYNRTDFTDISVSQSWWYRRDLDSILLCVFIISIFFIFIFNIITSCFKKGGVFGGLI